MIRNEKVDVFESVSSTAITGTLAEFVMQQAEVRGLDLSSGYTSVVDGQVYLAANTSAIREALISHHTDGQEMTAGSDFRSDFYTVVNITSDKTGDSVNLNVRVENDGSGTWSMKEGEVLFDRNEISSGSTNGIAAVGSDTGDEIADGCPVCDEMIGDMWMVCAEVGGDA